MAVEALQSITLAIILGALAAIIYSLRILVLLERRIARMDHHIELMTLAVLKGEKKLIKEEEHIEHMLEAKTRKKSSKTKSRKKSAKKSSKKSTKKSSKKSSSRKK